MKLPRVLLSVQRFTARAVPLWLSMAFVALPGIEGRAQEVLSAKDLPKRGDETDGPSRPLSAEAARTWIALHETKIQPLSDGTPLRQVLQALRDATRGKAGWAEGVRFRVVSEALASDEITLDAPVTLPFVGRPEVPVDLYLKYLLHQFVWERYVGEGVVVINTPCDDCVGYATVNAAEAQTWLLLHQTIPLQLPQRASLGDLLSAITRATRGQGYEGRGLVIYPATGALRAKAVTMSSPVSIGPGLAELGERLRETLKPLALGLRVLSDGTVMLTELAHGDARESPEGAFPEFRFSYSFVWKAWAKAQMEAAQAQRELEQLRKAARR